MRCLLAISYVPSTDVFDAFETLMDDMPRNEKLLDVATYFEHIEEHKR